MVDEGKELRDEIEGRFMTLGLAALGVVNRLRVRVEREREGLDVAALAMIGDDDGGRRQ